MFWRPFPTPFKIFMVQVIKLHCQESSARASRVEWVTKTEQQRLRDATGSPGKQSYALNKSCCHVLQLLLKAQVHYGAGLK